MKFQDIGKASKFPARIEIHLVKNLDLRTDRRQPRRPSEIDWLMGQNTMFDVTHHPDRQASSRNCSKQFLNRNLQAATLRHQPK